MAIGSIPIVGGVLAGRTTASTGTPAATGTPTAVSPPTRSTASSPQSTTARSATSTEAAIVDISPQGREALAAGSSRPDRSLGYGDSPVASAAQKLKSTVTGMEMFRTAQSAGGGPAVAAAAQQIGPTVAAEAKNVAVSVRGRSIPENSIDRSPGEPAQVAEERRKGLNAVNVKLA